MVLIDKYYTVIGKKTEDVHCFWKTSHIVTFCVACISSAVTAYGFGRTLNAFGNNCILYPNITFEQFGIPDKGDNAIFIRSIDFISTDWGSQKLCDFCLFSKIISAIFAFIWGTFFVINPKGGLGRGNYGISPPYQIVFPTLIAVFIVSIIMSVSAKHIYFGVQEFCSQFKTVFNTTKCTDSIDIYSLQFNDKEEPVKLLLTITRSAIIISVLAWVCQFLLLLLRFLFGIDYQILIVNISSKDSPKDKNTIEEDAASETEV